MYSQDYSLSHPLSLSLSLSLSLFPTQPSLIPLFSLSQLMLQQQQQLLFQQQQAQGQSSAQTPATSQVSTVQQPLKQEVLQVEATPTPSSTVSGGATPQATPTPTTTAGGSIWGRKTVSEDDSESAKY